MSAQTSVGARERETSLDHRLVTLAQTIGRCAPDRTAGFQAICECATDLLSVDRAGVWLYEPSNSEIRCATIFERETRSHSDGMRLNAKEFPAYFAALSRSRIIAADNASADERTAEFDESYLQPHGIGAMLDSPIRVGGRHIGILCNESVGPPRRWTDRECALAGTLGDFAALCIESCDRMNAEEERRELEIQLARVQRTEGLGRLASGISHDVENLLTVIHGNLKLMQTELVRECVDHAALSAEIHTMNEAVERAARLTRKLAGVSTTGGMDIRPLDPAQILSDLARSLRRSAPTGIVITVRSTPDTPPVEMDAAQFERIVLALAQNAIESMPDGGALRLRTDYFADTGRNGALELNVHDSGVGISAEALPLIFEPFFSTKKIGRGWGLGLVEVQALVEAQGGKIFVRSEPDRGTTFRVLLPAAAPAGK